MTEQADHSDVAMVITGEKEKKEGCIVGTEGGKELKTDKKEKEKEDTGKSENRKAVYKCVQCPYYGDESYVKRHVITAHQKVVEAPYYCKLCLVKGPDMGAMLRHIEDSRHKKEQNSRGLTGDGSNFIVENKKKPYCMELHEIDKDRENEKSVYKCAPENVDKDVELSTPLTSGSSLSSSDGAASELKMIGSGEQAKSGGVGLGKESGQLKMVVGEQTPQTFRENNPLTYMCTHCPFKGEQNSVKWHVITAHKRVEDAPYYCKLCLIRGEDMEAMDKHIKGAAHMRKVKVSGLQDDQLKAFVVKNEKVWEEIDKDVEILAPSGKGLGSLKGQEKTVRNEKFYYKCIRCDFIGRKERAKWHVFLYHLPIRKAPLHCSLCQYRIPKAEYVQKHLNSDTHKTTLAGQEDFGTDFIVASEEQYQVKILGKEKDLLLVTDLNQIPGARALVKKLVDTDDDFYTVDSENERNGDGDNWKKTVRNDMFYYKCMHCDFIGRKERAIWHVFLYHLPIQKAPLHCSLCRYRIPKAEYVQKHLNSDTHKTNLAGQEDFGTDFVLAAKEQYEIKFLGKERDLLLVTDIDRFHGARALIEKLVDTDDNFYTVDTENERNSVGNDWKLWKVVMLAEKRKEKGVNKMKEKELKGMDISINAVKQEVQGKEKEKKKEERQNMVARTSGDNQTGLDDLGYEKRVKIMGKTHKKDTREMMLNQDKEERKEKTVEVEDSGQKEEFMVDVEGMDEQKDLKTRDDITEQEALDKQDDDTKDMETGNKRENKQNELKQSCLSSAIESSGIARYRCVRCGFTDTNKWDAAWHVVRWHKTCDEAPFYCSLCQFKISTRKDIKNHLRSKDHKQKIVGAGDIGAQFIKEGTNPYAMKFEGKERDLELVENINSSGMGLNVERDLMEVEEGAGVVPEVAKGVQEIVRSKDIQEKVVDFQQETAPSDNGGDLKGSDWDEKVDLLQKGTSEKGKTEVEVDLTVDAVSQGHERWGKEKDLIGVQVDAVAGMEDIKGGKMEVEVNIRVESEVETNGRGEKEEKERKRLEVGLTEGTLADRMNVERKEDETVDSIMGDVNQSLHNQRTLPDSEPLPRASSSDVYTPDLNVSKSAPKSEASIERQMAWQCKIPNWAVSKIKSG